MSDFNPAPKGPPRAKKARKYLPKNTKPIARHSWLTKSDKPIKASNDERRRRREKAFKKFLGSSVWKAIRLETFKVHDFICVKCGWEDATRTGLGLVCDHVSYRRFGGQEIVGEDTRCLCRRCSDTATVELRANWAQPRRRRG